MRFISHGLDLIECERIEKVWHEHPDRFLGRILTPTERAYCEKHKYPVPRIAGRFAAKEAILKALGTGWRSQIAWTDIEITNDSAGQPHVTLSGHCREVAAKLGITRILLSITHIDKYAAASAIGVAD
jgi:holo-[acyl-carrier protein] synthase